MTTSWELRLVTKDEQYAIPSFTYQFDGNATVETLTEVVRKTLADNLDPLTSTGELDLVEFDFLICGKLLRCSIGEHLTEEKISSETVVEVEYFVSVQPPKPISAFVLDDWVVALDTVNDWLLSGGYDGIAHIWNLNQGFSHHLKIAAHATNAPIRALQWIRSANKSDKYHFVTSSFDETIKLWSWQPDTSQVEHIYTYKGHSRSVDCIDVQNDLMVSGSYDHMLKIWSLSEIESSDTESSNVKKLKTTNSTLETKSKLRAPVLTLEGHKDAVTGCVWVRNETDTGSASISTVATASMDRTIRLWDIELAEQKQTFYSNVALLGIHYSPLNGLLASAATDRHIRLWDSRLSTKSDTQTASQMISVCSSHTGWVSSVYWCQHNDNMLISGSYDKIVKVWDIRSTTVPLFDLSGHENKVLAVNWANNDFIVSGGADNRIKIYRA